MADRIDARLAMEIAESMDLPDGAFWAIVEELSGCDPAEAYLGTVKGPSAPAHNGIKNHYCTTCNKRFYTKRARVQHQRDLRGKDGHP